MDGGDIEGSAAALLAHANDSIFPQSKGQDKEEID